MENSEFLSKLQDEAKLQAKLNQNRLLPKQLDPVTSLIGTYSWQVLAALSFVSATVLEILKITGS